MTTKQRMGSPTPQNHELRELLKHIKGFGKIVFENRPDESNKSFEYRYLYHQSKILITSAREIIRKCMKTSSSGHAKPHPEENGKKKTAKVPNRPTEAGTKKPSSNTTGRNYASAAKKPATSAAPNKQAEKVQNQSNSNDVSASNPVSPYKQADKVQKTSNQGNSNDAPAPAPKQADTNIAVNGLTVDQKNDTQEEKKQQKKKVKKHFKVDSAPTTDASFGSKPPVNESFASNEEVKCLSNKVDSLNASIVGSVEAAISSLVEKLTTRVDSLTNLVAHLQNAVKPMHTGGTGDNDSSSEDEVVIEPPSSAHSYSTRTKTKASKSKNDQGLTSA